MTDHESFIYRWLWAEAGAPEPMLRPGTRLLDDLGVDDDDRDALLAAIDTQFGFRDRDPAAEAIEPRTVADLLDYCRLNDCLNHGTILGDAA